MLLRVRAFAIIGSLALAAATTLGGCGWFAAGKPAAAPTTEGTASAAPDGSQTITVTGNERMRFDPSLIHAHPGRLRITLTVVDPTPHDLKVLATGADTGMVERGQSRTIDVTFDKPGRYDFVCTYHERNGMTGTIEIS